MRLDKYLKVSRLIKRRSVAAAMCQAGRILVNGKTAKASSELKIGDRLTLLLGNKTKELEVLDVPLKLTHAHNSPQGAATLYSLCGETYNEDGSELCGQVDSLFLDLLGED